jgi:hypothetical protein
LDLNQAKPPQIIAEVFYSACKLVGVCLPILRIVPVVDILFDLIFGEAVTLLDFAFKLISFAVDCGKVVGEISPFLFDLALHLLPVPFDAIPVHLDLRYEKFFERTICRSKRSSGRPGSNAPLVTFSLPPGPRRNQHWV